MPAIPVPAQEGVSATGTPYDAVAYPSTLFTQTSPDRLATVARLAGLTPPPIATARMLEIACGDGMNLIALASAWPDAEFVGFDLAASAIERGRRWIADSGIANVRLEVLDITDAAAALGGEFDYIVAHGLYAWVPSEVRAATMRLIGAALGEHGVAYLSYNAMPGGYFRMAVRDALLFAIEDIEGDDARVAAAQANLHALIRPNEEETAAQVALRHAAQVTLTQAGSVLRHDELGEHYYPQSLTDVIKVARGEGLRFLGEAVQSTLHQAFIPDEIIPADDVETQILHIRQAEDYRFVRFFRSTLLVRDAARPKRRLDLDAVRGLYAATWCSQIDARNFRDGDQAFEVHDDGLAEILGKLVAAWPSRVLVADLDPSDALVAAIFDMFDGGILDLYTTPPRHAIETPEHPRVAGLTRMLLGAGTSVIPTLDHRVLSLPDAGMRSLLARLDGTLDHDALRALGEDIGIADPDTLAGVLRSATRRAILLP